MLAREMRRAQLVELATYLLLAYGVHAWGWGAAAALLLVPALVLGTRLAAVFTMHGLSWTYRMQRGPAERISARAAFAMVLREYRAFTAMSLLYVPWEARFARPDPPVDATGDPAVVLVHGYFVNRGCWVPFLRYLEEAGIQPVFLPNCRSHFATIERFEEDLHQAIERITRHGARRVVLVGHSMGGLALRLYLARRGAGRVAALVTIGAPHHGTRLACWGLGENARQMEPGSRFLEDLRDREVAQPKPRCLSIYSAHDDMVMPQDSSRLPWARNVVVSGRGHISLFRAPEVARLVIEEIRQAR